MRMPRALGALLLVLGTAAVLQAPAAGSGAIAWHDYDAGMNLSREGGLPVMMDFSTDWCSWCKEMDKDTWSDGRVINRSERFSCIKVDGDDRGDLVSKYKIDGYPTTVFLDPDGTEKHRVVGYLGPDDFIRDQDFALGKGPKPAASRGTCALALLPLLVVPAIIVLRRR